MRNSNATMLDDSGKPHTRVFDLGSNAENIFTKPDNPSVDLSRAVMVGMELLQVCLHNFTTARKRTHLHLLCPDQQFFPLQWYCLCI